MATISTTDIAVKEETFKFHSWTVTVRKSHILPSKCTSAFCEEIPADRKKCTFCRYEEEIHLPQLPEMTFGDNLLRIEHDDGFGIEFNCMDALKLVDHKNDLMKVAVAEAWMQARENTSHIKDVVKPFDWTYTTAYKGTLFSGEKSLKVSETSDRIDVEKLKVKQKILFYDDIHLFEDELADNGTAQCTVKIRIMPDSFFVLLRFFLRVDNLLARINDTRIYYEVENNHILREYMSKEGQLMNEEMSTTLLTNPSELWEHLQVKYSHFDKLQLPS